MPAELYLGFKAITASVAGEGFPKKNSSETPVFLLQIHQGNEGFHSCDYNNPRVQSSWGLYRETPTTVLYGSDGSIRKDQNSQPRNRNPRTLLVPHWNPLSACLLPTPSFVFKYSIYKSMPDSDQVFPTTSGILQFSRHCPFSLTPAPFYLLTSIRGRDGRSGSGEARCYTLLNTSRIVVIR